MNWRLNNTTYHIHDFVLPRNHVKYRFVLEEIKSLEKIESTEEEVNSFAEKTAASYGMEKEDFLKAVGGIESIKYEVEMNKVVDFLKENN